MPLLATDDILIFPRFTRTLQLTDTRHMNAIRHQIAEHEPYVGVFLKHAAHRNQPVDRLQQIHPVGTFAHLLEARDYGDRMTVTVRAVRRILATDVQPVDQLGHVLQPSTSRVSVDNLLHEAFEHTAVVRATTQEIVRTIRDMAVTRSLPVDLLKQLEQENQYVIQDTMYVCDLGAVSAAGATPIELQAVLAERNIPRRLMTTLQLLKRELEHEQMQRRIGEEVEENVRQMHRKFMLLERVKVIKKELGMGKLNDREAIADRMEARLEGRQLSAEVRAIFDDEVKRLRTMPDAGADFNVLRNYLDWLTVMPWGQRTAENLNIAEARQVLDGDHFGMVEVKQRILEFIAVSQLKGSTQGKILCFHGPPGVGKTSIARSIARALNRKYFRFSVGGMNSAAEVKGHRRTYVGAMPGKLVQCLKATGAENPLVLIDEIDKIGSAGHSMGVGNAGVGGDPAAALLELLDPQQNASFMDFYLDVPVDLSRVLFICTANYVDGIAPVLADRMELIEMSGYVDAEKSAIAEQYLIPRALREAGMTERMLRFEPDALEMLMQNYCAESGVRQMQHLIEKVVRKVAYQVVMKKKPAGKVVVIDVGTLAEYLGKSTNPTERLFAAEEPLPPGVVMGLGLTHHGGTVIYVETTSTPLLPLPSPRGRIRSLQLTGNLGSVMRESADIALTVARNTLTDPRYLDEHCVHVHVPMGAQPKDGASAGVTIVAALQSLAMHRPVRPDLALTGELSLNGKVLAVGGIREKALAAQRLGVRCVILPADNRWDYEVLPDGVKNGLEVHFVEEYADVARIIFA